MSHDAIKSLGAGFEAGTQGAQVGRDAVLVSWPCVPVEIIRAAGYRPVAARASAGPTPAADAVLEPGIFPSRLRKLVDDALAGRLSEAAAIVLPRTSEVDYKCFLYLREFARHGMPLPPVLLFDLLQSGAAQVRDHNRDRARELFGRLASLAGVSARDAAVTAQIRHCNVARHAARRLDCLRREGRIAGAAAMPLLAAFWQMPAGEYARLANAAADTIAASAPIAGSRVLLTGVPVDSPAQHRDVEARLGIVVAETSPFGSDAAGPDIATDTDPFDALACWYSRHVTTSRTPVNMLMDRIAGLLDGIDAVALWLPPWDTTFGWDLPRLRKLLSRHGLACTVVGSDAPVQDADILHMPRRNPLRAEPCLG